MTGRAGATRTMHFAPAPALPSAKAEAKELLPANPGETFKEAAYIPDVLIYGRMLADAEIITEALRTLHQQAGEYASNLRLILGAARRMAERAKYLLGSVVEVDQ